MNTYDYAEHCKLILLSVHFRQRCLFVFFFIRTALFKVPVRNVYSQQKAELLLFLPKEEMFLKCCLYIRQVMQKKRCGQFSIHAII